MRKKLLSICLATGMLMSSLTGCGETKTTQNEQNETKQSVAETVPSDVSSEATEPEEITTVTWVIRTPEQEDDEQVVEAMNELLRERYNLELNLIAIPAAEFNDRMRLMITSGEDYDLCYTSSFANKFADNVIQGSFLALNDLLESEDLADFREVYPEGLENVATVGGNIYALPNYQLIYFQNSAYVQKDLADKYGLDYSVDYINGLTDIKDFMDKVRDNEKDMFVINEKGSFEGAYVGKMYDVFGNMAYVSADDDDYKVQFQFDIEDAMDGFKVLNSFYKDGYVRSDVATVVDNTADMKANRYAIYITTGKPGGEIDISNSQGEEYVQIPLGNEPYLKPNAGITTMTAVNVNSKNPEAALKLYSVMWTDPEIYNMFVFGLEGEHYKKVGENRVELIPDSGYDRSGFAWQLGNQFNAWLLPGQADTLWEETEAINRSAKQSKLMGFTFDTTKVETELSQISSVVTEYGNRYKYCEDVEAWFNEYRDKLIAAGAYDVVEEVQRQIDEWRVANGK